MKPVAITRDEDGSKTTKNVGEPCEEHSPRSTLEDKWDECYNIVLYAHVYTHNNIVANYYRANKV
jgi:hypothetical protein